MEINVAWARSGGNPRVLDYLLKTGRGLLDPSEIDNEIELDDLIQKRITDALGTALERGYEEKDVNAFLAGLAVLPPPVPLDEYAGAHGIDISAIESFASDLSPLLERTSHGLMFRDEPTETLVHQRYATSREALHRVAANLLARQEISVYAARSLPGLLHELDDSEQLFALAFDERIPASITSTVGKRNVQYARLKAATLHAALKKDYNSLVRLLLELSTIAAVDQRGVDYILDHPDLVVAAKDVDARRRLFEIRTGWPGTRHARLAIAYTLSGQFEEAYRHAYADSEWIEHYLQTEHANRPSEPGPEHADIAAIPFFLISQGRGADAARYLGRWRDWYSYEVCEYVFTYAHLAQTIRSEPPRRLGACIGALSSAGTLAAALSFDDLPRAKRKDLAIKLAKLCKSATQLHMANHYSRRRTYELEDGLRKASALALTLGLGTEALTISRQAPHKRPGVWAFRDAFNHRDVFSYVFQTALVAAAKNQPLHERDLLPKGLERICSRIPRKLTGKPFRDKAREKLSKVPRRPRDDGTAKYPNAMSYDEQQSAERFLGIRLEPLLSITKALSAVLAASARSVDEHFVALVETWEQARTNRDQYRTEGIDPFFHLLGLEAVFFVLWARSELKQESVKRLLTAMDSHNVGASDIVRIVSVLAKRAPLQTLAGEQAIKARTLIEKEDEVNYRASLYGALGRAMLLASIDEASVYFRDGLEQMDAIGSGDYQFTNELLLFASQVKGNELSERDFHTLTNICELNMGEEPEKFFWGAFGRGLARAAGPRGLAKLSRWDDRSKIALDNTLLPYLTGLLEAGKIDANDALALNRLANPVEYWSASTKEFAEALRQQAGPDPVAIAELINQFEDDNPNFAGDDTVEALRVLAEEALGASHDITRHIAAARAQYAIAREGRNKSTSYSSEPDRKMRREAATRNEQNRQELACIAATTDPLDEASLVKAIAAFNALGNMYDLKAGFFSALRDKVPFSGRGRYVRNIAGLEDLYFYWKFAELKDAREAWAESSAALSDVYRELAYPLILAHADDFVHDGRLSGSNIKEISEFTGVSMAELVLEVIKVFSRPDSAIAGSVWLALASFIAPKADDGQGQLSLSRLLSSDAARLADNVGDGPWMRGRYPSTDTDEIAAGLIWRVLGSPHAVDRWRAAHCLRSFARFGRWDVIDRVVHHSASKTAGVFQAPELTFYYLHARLWLLIALARMALDHPEQIARYKDDLLAIATETTTPHVLMQHFAAQILIICITSGKLVLPAKTLKAFRGVAKSPYPRQRKKIRTGVNFYHGRPKGVPKPLFEFYLDYDFHKHDVDNLSRVFDLGCWEVADMISGIVHKLDPNVTAMYADGGRESRQRTLHGLTSRFHGYGQHLGWHALFFAAGKLLPAHPVTDWLYDDDPWDEWLGHYSLTRKDGLWLSDGTDRTPIDTTVALLEKRKKELAITGSPGKLLQLAGLGAARVGKELVIEARWFSSDHVRIQISSALVPSAKAARFARILTREEPMISWVPVFQETDEGDEYLQGEKKEYTPWIVYPSSEARLDEHDPYGASVANTRPRLARSYVALCKLTRGDPFGRTWHDYRGTTSLRAQAWDRNDGGQEDGPHPGERLLCRSSVLKKILTTHGKDLLVLINLQRYEKWHQGGSTYTHSVAVARVNKSLDVEYFRGRINHLHKSRY